MFKFGFQNKENRTLNATMAYVLERIKEGDIKLKEQFIKDNIPYITKMVASLSGIYVDDKNSEEYSIGLSAFNEAIDNYDPNRNGDFFKYSNIVIKHRLIDYIRKNKRHLKVLPFSYLEEYIHVDDRCLMSDSHYQFEKIEVKEELILFEKSLGAFQISLDDLVISSPKHKDSRILCIRIARILSENDDMFVKLIKKKCIPLSDLLKHVSVSSKTVQRNRKFIIAVSLILRSNLEDLKNIVKSFERRGKA